jgi:hypothetical protein
MGSFTPPPLYPRGKSSQYPLNGSPRRFGRRGEEKILYTDGVEPGPVCYPTSYTNALCRLHTWDETYWNKLGGCVVDGGSSGSRRVAGYGMSGVSMPSHWQDHDRFANLRNCLGAERARYAWKVSQSVGHPNKATGCRFCAVSCFTLAFETFIFWERMAQGDLILTHTAIYMPGIPWHSYGD